MVLQKIMNAPSGKDWQAVRYLLGFREPEITFIDERPWKLTRRRATAEDLIAAHEEIQLRMMSALAAPLTMDFENVPNMVDWIRKQKLQIKTCNPYMDRDHWLRDCYYGLRIQEEFKVKYLGEFNIESEENTNENVYRNQGGAGGACVADH